MATPTYDLLDSTTLSSSASSVTFDNLDTVAAGYRDLIIVLSNGTSANAYRARFNSDTGSNYYSVTMSGDGSTTSSASLNTTFARFGGANASSGLNIMQILDFNSTDKHKSYLVNPSQSSVFAAGAEAGRWANTAAINTILVFGLFAFDAGSTFYLYGIAS